MGTVLIKNRTVPITPIISVLHERLCLLYVD